MKPSGAAGRGTAGRIRMLGLALASFLLLTAATAAPAGAAITGTNSAITLGNALSSAELSGATIEAAPGPPFPNGTGNTPLGGFPTNGNTFAILTTGDVSLADDPNSSESSGYSQGLYGQRRGAIDVTTLFLTADVPPGRNCLSFDYKFLSEEFPEYVGSTFNDRFIAELYATTWAVEGQTINAYGDFAAFVPVSVNGIGPTSVSPANAAGTTYDAGSASVTTKHPVYGFRVDLYLSIFDAGDAAYDSAVFVDNLRFTDEPKVKCIPPDIFGGKVGVDLPNSAEVKNGKAIIPITCDGLPVGVTNVECEGTVELSCGGSAVYCCGGSAVYCENVPSQVQDRAAISKKKGKKKLSVKKKYSIPPGLTEKVKVKLKKNAKRALAKRGRLKTKAKVRNTINGARKTFKLKLKY